MEQNLIRRELQIEEMTCSGCEIRIENALRALQGVTEVRAVYSISMLSIVFDPKTVSLEKIISTTEHLGYRVKLNPLNGSGLEIDREQNLSGDKFSVTQLLGIGIILFALYFIINNTVGFNFIPQVDQSMSYGILFTVGLLTSLHCIGMCGGINLSQCVAITDPPHAGKYSLSTLKPSLLYNLGRVISYTVIGGIVGSLGSVIGFSGGAKGIVAIIAGVFMIVMGANMLNIIPWLRKLTPRLPRFFADKIYNNTSRRPLYVGLLNGFMPCGPLQAMQLYALASGSMWVGAMSMLAFSLGTVPLMFGLGAISSLLSTKFTKRLMKASAVLVIFLGIVMLNRGLSLSGFSGLAAVDGTDYANKSNVALIEGNFQTVTTSLDAGRYSPIVVQEDIPVKWTITAQQSDLNGCNNPIIIPKYDIERTLVPGDNLIEFTPDEEGNITYTCWMGMISSNIKVVADLKKVSDQEMQQLDTSSSGSAGCCSTGSAGSDEPAAGCCGR